MYEMKGELTSAFPKDYCVIDVETTGLDPCKDKIIEIAAIKVRDNEVLSTFQSLINPEVEISDFITNLTGITNADLASAPDMDAIIAKFYDFIGDDILVGHNIIFDANFIYNAFIKVLDKPLVNDYFDTLRMSRKYIKGLPSYKLTALASLYNITADRAHRALADCYTTLSLMPILRQSADDYSAKELDKLNDIVINPDNPFFLKRVAFKGVPQLFTDKFYHALFEKCNVTSLSDVFFKNSDYLIMGNAKYKSFILGKSTQVNDKARALIEQGTLTVLSETELCQLLGISVAHGISAKPSDIKTNKTDFDETHPIYGKLCVFTGKLEKMSRADAMQIVVNLGGKIGASVTSKTDFLILGNNDYNPLVKDGKSSKQKKAEDLKLKGSDIEILSEDVFYNLTIDEN